MKNVDIVLGLQWGDEGKGKIIDTRVPNYDVVARFAGGPNAGHTIIFDGKDGQEVKHVLHTLPSGVLHENTINFVGPGVVINPVLLVKEIKELEEKFGIDITNRLCISSKAALITPIHMFLDNYLEEQKGKQKIGSTKKGIGPTYTDDTARIGLRVADIFVDNFIEKLDALIDYHRRQLPFTEEEPIPEINMKVWIEATRELKKYQIIEDSKSFLSGKKVLAEGAQGYMLDIKHGTYPYVTSSNTGVAGTLSGLGISFSDIGDVYGVFKAYTTRVGNGPFPTELTDNVGEALRIIGNEFGATTGRPRRCGWLDLVALKYAVHTNGITHLVMMKSDVLDNFSEIPVCVAYERDGKILKDFPDKLECIIPIFKNLDGWNEDTTKVRKDYDMPRNLQKYIRYIEEYIGVHIVMVSVGPNRDQMIKNK